MSNESKPLVIYHANCNDGFAAAWVARRKLGDECEFFAASYGQPPPDVAGRKVYILDFSYKRPVMRRILSEAMSVTVLDHHKTAEAELDGIVDEFVMRPDLIANPPGSELPTVWFNMQKSGARLAWEHFFPNEASPPLVAYVEDRDMWRFALPFSNAVNAAISSRPHDFPTWDAIDQALRFDIDASASMVSQGEAIERYKAQQVDAICRNAREVDFDGVKILAANTSTLFSEVAGKLAEGRPFGAAWFVRADGKRQWSLRSTDDGMDVSEVAKSKGGGGHRNAAGFEED